MERRQRTKTSSRLSDSRYLSSEHLKPLVEKAGKKWHGYSLQDRMAVMKHLEGLFKERWIGPVPRATVIFRPPASSLLAKEFAGEPDPIAAFRRKGPLAVNIRMETYFNGWKTSSFDEVRMAILAHEFAHIFFKEMLIRNYTCLKDRFAYICATEGIACFAEKDWLRASGYRKPFLKRVVDTIKKAGSTIIENIAGRLEIRQDKREKIDDEYTLGSKFFNAIADQLGVAGAFHRLSSDLPQTMTEIFFPHLYLQLSKDRLYGLDRDA